MEQYQKSGYRKAGRYQKKQAGDGLHVLLFYVLPFLIFNGLLFLAVIAKPKASLVVADTNDYLSTEVTLTVNSWFPTKSVLMTLDGESLELTKGKKRTYTATVYKNGSVEANIVNLNGMPLMIYDHVNVLDDNPPAFDNTDIMDGVVTLTISDSQSGINFDSIYAVNSKEERVEPLTIDRSSNTLSFEMDSAGLHVYAQDRAGNEVQGTFTSYKEGGTERVEGGADEPSEAEEAADTGAAAAGTSETVSGTTAGSTAAGSTTAGASTSAAQSSSAGSTSGTKSSTSASSEPQIVIN